MPNIKFQKGFSLNELLLVIAIIGIMTTIIIVGLNQLSPHYKLKGASREVVAALRDAQNSAVSKQYTYIVRFTANNYSIIRNDAGGEVIETTKELPTGINIQNITLPSSQVSFSSSGSANTSGSLELINNQSKVITISISVSGQIESN